jgi:serine/threonine protein kinase
VELIGTYTWKNVFAFIMDPVADTDLHQFLSQVDFMERGQERDQMCDRILIWTGCMIHALDYMHEMRVKHRDIKPSNILVKGDVIYFTDFGISRIIPSGLTTGTNGTFGPMTRTYVAPEALLDNARRGRTIDIFSLGCIFLEMGTVLIGPCGSLTRFQELRKKNTGATVFAQNSKIIPQWIWHLWAHWATILEECSPPKDQHARYGAALPDLAFMMLDPNPDYRITSRQFIVLIRQSSSQYFLGIVNDLCCKVCQSPTAVADENSPLHSVFKEVDDLEYPASAEHAMRVPVASDWKELSTSGYKVICGGR